MRTRVLVVAAMCVSLAASPVRAHDADGPAGVSGSCSTDGFGSQCSAKQDSDPAALRVRFRAEVQSPVHGLLPGRALAFQGGHLRGRFTIPSPASEVMVALRLRVDKAVTGASSAVPDDGSVGQTRPVRPRSVVYAALGAKSLDCADCNTGSLLYLAEVSSSGRGSGVEDDGTFQVWAVMRNWKGGLIPAGEAEFVVPLIGSTSTGDGLSGVGRAWLDFDARVHSVETF